MLGRINAIEAMKKIRERGKVGAVIILDGAEREGLLVADTSVGKN